MINQPLVPASVAPNSGAFVLKVTGTGFAPTAVLNWNGSSRVTIVNSSDSLQAYIQASDVARAGTVSVTVSNPAPGGTSSPVFFPIRQDLAAVNMSLQSSLIGPGAVVVGDFNKDGKPDVAVGMTNSNGTGTINLYFGNGNGTFQAPITSSSTLGASSFFAVDVNNDGNLDLLVTYAYFDQYDNYYSEIYVLFGNGDGTFTQSTSVMNFGCAAEAVGDWNGDGKVDIIINDYPGGFYSYTYAYLGNGDGTFSYGGEITPASGYYPTGTPAVGDFNGDGRVDLAFPNPSVAVALGNGDGTFQPAITYPAGYSTGVVQAVDLNGDGKLDLVTNGVSVLLGNGDGTFTYNWGITLQTGGFYIQNIEVGDFNGDGLLDVVVQAYENQSPYAQQIELLLGKGDGTFQNPVPFSAGKFVSERALDLGVTLDMADFNNDGKLDLIWGGGPQTYILQQNLISLTPSSLAFGNQNIDTTSAPQTVTITNIGTASINITSLGLNGPNPSEYAITSGCGSSIAGGASCAVQITFTPTSLGLGSATLQGTFQGQGTAQKVSLSGTGVPAPRVTLTPTAGLMFPTQLVGTTCLNKTATLTNVGSQPTNISSITTTGPFTQTNNCGAVLYPYNSCTIQVVFTPTGIGSNTGTLTVTDDASRSPQTIKLSGVGTVIELSATGVNFGNEKVGNTSTAVPVTVTNTGRVAISISSISISGTNFGDFAETNNCGASLAGNQSCTVRVTFTPSALGSRSATLDINDNGGGSPQTAALVGTGD